MRRQSGFTLIELLVAAALLALIVATAAGGLRFGARAWDRTSESAEAALEGRALRGFLRALIEGAAPIRLREGEREPPVLFLGAQDRLTLAAPLPSALAPPGLHLVSLAFEPAPSGGGLALVMRWRALGALRPALSLPPQDGAETLVSGLERGGFAYLGPDGAAVQWRGPAPPRLVEIAMAGAALGPWPALAAAPRAGVAP
ncbi:prepilin-type N-terminal cleavage/methylation domain-containing protein [Rubrimonas cliftonensis]|uniref:Prepilin-type N-terminal cleavage/methylation domain-containing protein n=1 Tax=Rubrimonas cliftonensis TaxID=89524 RepID=A0A1H3WQL9_9RHOB|nr:prepilin-type N-terminal cleavage/methylation domain-containing protein [Rubrimonas cliftonensis]SDZ89240.1 prepilin-type N-terminal cleavage/methylation domain-containing protein [Rubrimonas cliftonensis]